MNVCTTCNEQFKASILIVEDEPMLAYLLEEFLIDAGFDIAGVAARLETALAMIESRVFDAAILDTNLAGVNAGPAASALVARGLPFIVVSGYTPEQQHSAFSGALCLRKPCRPDDLVQALRTLLLSTSRPEPTRIASATLRALVSPGS
jgi:DNA-binding response OmpR family regulator